MGQDGSVCRWIEDSLICCAFCRNLRHKFNLSDDALRALHRLWDGLLTSSYDVRTLRNMATELRSKFPKAGLTELASAEAEVWAKESFEIATETAYQNGTLRGTPKGQHKECVVKSSTQRCCRMVIPRQQANSG